MQIIIVTWSYFDLTMNKELKYDLHLIINEKFHSKEKLILKSDKG